MAKIILGSTNKEKGKKLKSDGKRIKKMAESYISREEGQKLIDDSLKKKTESEQLEDTLNKKCVSDDNEVYDLFVAKAKKDACNAQVDNFKSYIYDDTELSNSDRLNKILEVYEAIEQFGLSEKDNLKVFKKCLTSDDVYSLVECACIEKERGYDRARESFGKTRR